MFQLVYRSFTSLIIVALSVPSFAAPSGVIEITNPRGSSETPEIKLPTYSPNTFAMSSACSEQKSIGITFGDQAAQPGESFSSTPIGSTSEKVTVGHAVYFDAMVKASMAQIFQRSQSSDHAREVVANVLTNHGCESSPVYNIPINEWGVADVYGGGGGAQIRANLIFQSMAVNHSADGGVVIDFERSLKNENPILGLNDAKKKMAYLRWQNLGYADDCGNVMSVVQGICSGEINAEDTFKEMAGKVDVRTAGGLGDILGGIGTGLGIYGLYSSMHEKDEIKRLNNEVRTARDNVAQYDKAISDLESKQIKQSDETHGGSGISDMGVQAPKGGENQINELKEKRALEKAKVTQAIADLEDMGASAPSKPEKEDSNGGSAIVEQIAYEHFLSSNWVNFQDGVIHQYKACKQDRSSPVAELTQDANSGSGETCDYSGAFEELRKITQTNTSVDPSIFSGEPVPELSEKIKLARQKVSCGPSEYDPDYSICLRNVNAFLNQIGIKGVEELCVLDPYNGICQVSAFAGIISSKANDVNLDPATLVDPLGTLVGVKVKGSSENILDGMTDAINKGDGLEAVDEYLSQQPPPPPQMTEAEQKTHDAKVTLDWLTPPAVQHERYCVASQKNYQSYECTDIRERPNPFTLSK